MHDNELLFRGVVRFVRHALLWDLGPVPHQPHACECVNSGVARGAVLVGQARAEVIFESCNNSTCKHTHSYTSTAYTTPYAEWPSPEERE